MTTNACDSVRILYKGDGTQKLYTFPFTYIYPSDVDVFLWDDTIKDYELVATDKWSFANATTISFFDAPPPPPTKVRPTDPDIYNVRISRLTDLTDMIARFYPGSAIRAEDLNDDFDQLRLAVQEQRCQLFGDIDQLKKHTWNRFSITLPNGLGTTITKPDQLEGRWPQDGHDNYVATTDAISARLDAYVQDNTPAPYGLPQREQNGKQWFDTDELVQRFWDADAAAWVTLANTGPQGPPGPNVFYGVAFPPEPNAYGLWYDTNRKELRLKYDDGTGIQWVLAGGTTPPIGQLVAGNGVAANTIHEISIIDQGVI